MKMHTPFFVIGLIVAVISYVGIPNVYEDIVVSVLGISLMILASTINHSDSDLSCCGNHDHSDSKPEKKEEEVNGDHLA